MGCHFNSEVDYLKLHGFKQKCQMFKRKKKEKQQNNTTITPQLLTPLGYGMDLKDVTNKNEHRADLKA